MKRLQFWFDPISPYAYLAFEQLPQALEGISHVVDYRPVLFAGLLKHFEHKGPAEIEPKRIWTYRDVAWRAHERGLPLQIPATHPFNPLPLLRLMLACAPTLGFPNRRTCEAVLHHVWRGGGEALDPVRLVALRESLSPQRDPDGGEVRAELHAAAQEALALGVFGVPTVCCEGRAFWGDDALPMLRAALQGSPWFGGADWQAASAPRAQSRRP